MKIADCPILMSLWHPTKNTELGFNPELISSQSHTKLWWICSKAHEWETFAYNISNRKTSKCAGCPYCSGKKVSPERSLAFLFPEIAKTWHETENFPLTPSDVVSKSHKHYYWQCQKDERHVWKTSIACRTSLLRGCPICSGNQVHFTTSLTAKSPHLVQQWDFQKNHPKTPDDVTTGSIYMAHWICINNSEHKWQATVVDRKRFNCPYCCNQAIDHTNNIQVTHPEIAKQWHPTKNTVKPTEVSYGSKVPIVFLCPKGHEWITTPKVRSKGCDCPKCLKSIGEKTIEKWLTEHNIKFKPQHRFKTCRKKKPLPFDFVVWHNKQVHCLEFQGNHHYEPIPRSPTDDGLARLQETQENDEIKRTWCQDKNIPLLEIHYMNKIVPTLENYFKLHDC